MTSPLDRIALISDVHGNLTALEAVLADIDARGIDRIFNLGDYVGKGPRGREVVDLCRERCEVNLLGNWDDFLPDPDRAFDNEALRWWLDQLGPGQGDWLRSLPFSHDFVSAAGGSGCSTPREETVHRRVRFDHDEAEFRALFTNTPATGDGPQPDVVGYADTHDPYYETDHDRRTVFNTGSVGNCMHDPTPVYVILEGVLDSPDDAPFSIQFVRVPYDVDAELAVATAMGLPELAGYELEIRHGIYRAQPHRARGRPPDLPPQPGRGGRVNGDVAGRLRDALEAAGLHLRRGGRRRSGPRRTPRSPATRPRPACAVRRAGRRWRRWSGCSCSSAPVPLAAAEAALPGLVDALCAEGLLERSVGEVAARLDCRPYSEDDTDLWVVSDLTPGLDGGPNRVGADHVLGISPASTSLAQLTIREPVGRRSTSAPAAASRRCTWPGTAAQVVATDVNAAGARGSPGSTRALNGRHATSRCATARSSSRSRGSAST